MKTSELVFSHKSHPTLRPVKERNREEISRWLIEEIPCYSKEKHRVTILIDGEPIGQVHLQNFERLTEPRTCIIGYWIDKKYWNKGFATLAVSYTANYALKNLQVDRVIAFIHEDNHSSITVAKNSGLTMSGLQKLAMYYGGTSDTHFKYVYGIV
jgi:RimJ/RimL family protein N-acetyltransferase